MMNAVQYTVLRGMAMSQLGQELISALEEAKPEGFVTLAYSPDVAPLIKNLSFKHQQAIASLYLEGIILSSDALDDIRAFDAGQLSKQDVIARAVGRAHIGETAEIAKGRLEAMVNQLES